MIIKKSVFAAVFFSLIIASRAFCEWVLPPVPVSTMLEQVTPVVGIDSAGNAVAVWQDDTNFPTSANILGSILMGETWSAPVTLSAGGINTSPQVAVNPSGNVIIVWENAASVSPITSVIQAFAFTLPGGFGSGTLYPSISTQIGPLDLVSQPAVAINPSGQVVVAWTVGIVGSYIQGVTGTVTASGATFSPPSPPISPAGTSDSPIVGIDSSGEAIIAWINESIGPAVQATDFGSGIFFTSASFSIANLSIAVTPSKQAIVVWDTGLNNLEATVFNGTSWSTEFAIQPSGSGTSEDPKAGVDDSGVATVVWSLIDGSSSFNIQMVTLNLPSVTPSAPKILSTRTYCTNPVVAVNPSGFAIVVWQNVSAPLSPSSTITLEAVIIEAGTISSITDLVTPTGPQNSALQQVAVNASGEAVVVWLYISDPEFGRGEVFSAIYFNRGPPVNVQGKQVLNRFLTQEDLIDILTWSPPPLSTPVAYRIYRDSALTDLAGTVSASGRLVFKDHNRNKKKIYTYYIVAVDASGNQSTPAVVVVGPYSKH